MDSKKLLEQNKNAEIINTENKQSQMEDLATKSIVAGAEPVAAEKNEKTAEKKSGEPSETAKKTVSTDDVKAYAGKKLKEDVPKKESTKARQAREKKEKTEKEQAAGNEMEALHRQLEETEQAKLGEDAARVHRKKYASLSTSDKKKRIANAIKRDANAKKIRKYERLHGEDEFEHNEIDEDSLREKIATFLKRDFAIFGMDTDEEFAANLEANYKLCQESEHMKRWLKSAAEGGYLPEDQDLETVEAQIAAYDELKQYLDTQKVLMKNPYYRYMAKEDIKYSDEEIERLAGKKALKDDTLGAYLHGYKTLKGLAFVRKKGMDSVKKKAKTEGKRQAKILRERGEKAEIIELLKESGMNYSRAERYLDKNYDANFTPEVFKASLENFKSLDIKALHMASIRDIAEHFAENRYIFEQMRSFEHLLFVAAQRDDFNISDNELIELRAKIKTLTVAEYTCSLIQVKMISDTDKYLNQKTYEDILADVNNGVLMTVGKDGTAPMHIGIDVKNYYNSILKAYKKDYKDRKKTIRITHGVCYAHKKGKGDDDWAMPEIGEVELEERAVVYEKNQFLNEYMGDLISYTQVVNSAHVNTLNSILAQKHGKKVPVIPTTVSNYVRGMSAKETMEILEVWNYGTEEARGELAEKIMTEIRSLNYTESASKDPKVMRRNMAYKMRMAEVLARLKLDEFKTKIPEHLRPETDAYMDTGNTHACLISTYAQANQLAFARNVPLEDWNNVNTGTLREFGEYAIDQRDMDGMIIIDGRTVTKNGMETNGLQDFCMDADLVKATENGYTPNQTMYGARKKAGLWKDMTDQDITDLLEIIMKTFVMDGEKCTGTHVDQEGFVRTIKERLEKEGIGGDINARPEMLFHLAHLNHYDLDKSCEAYKALFLNEDDEQKKKEHNDKRVEVMEDCIKTVMSFDLNRFNFRSYKDLYASTKEDPDRFRDCYAVSRMCMEMTRMIEDYRKLAADGTAHKLAEEHLAEVDSRVRLIMSVSPFYSQAFFNVIFSPFLKDAGMSMDEALHQTGDYMTKKIDEANEDDDDDAMNFWQNVQTLAGSLEGFDVDVNLADLEDWRRMKDGLNGESKKTQILNILNGQTSVLKGIKKNIHAARVTYIDETVFMKQFGTEFAIKDLSVSERETKMKHPKSRLKVKRENYERISGDRKAVLSKFASYRRNLDGALHMALGEDTLADLSAYMGDAQAQNEELARKYADEKGAGRFEALDLITKEFMQMDLVVSISDDASFAQAAGTLQKISSRARAYEKLLKENPKYADRLKVYGASKSKLDYDIVQAKLNEALVLSDYYRARTMLLTDSYYVNHYNDELSANHNDRSTDDQKRIADLIRLTAQCTRRLDSGNAADRADTGIDDILSRMEEKSRHTAYLLGQVDLKKAMDGDRLKKENDEIRRYFDKVRTITGKRNAEIYQKIIKGREHPYPEASKYETQAVKNHIAMMQTNWKQRGKAEGLFDILTAEQKELYNGIEDARNFEGGKLTEFELINPKTGETLKFHTDPARVLLSIVVLYGKDLPKDEVLEMFDDFNAVGKYKLDLNNEDQYEYARKRWLSGAKKLFKMEYDSLKRFESTYGSLPDQLPVGSLYMSLGESKGEFVNRMIFGQDIAEYTDTAEQYCVTKDGEKCNLASMLAKEGIISEAEYKDAVNVNNLFYQGVNSGLCGYRGPAGIALYSDDGDDEYLEANNQQYNELVRSRYQRNNYRIRGPKLSFGEERKAFKEAMENDQDTLMPGVSQELFAENKLGIMDDKKREAKKQLRKQKAGLIHYYESTVTERAEVLTSMIAQKLDIKENDPNMDLLMKFICFHPAMLTEEKVSGIKADDNDAFIADFKLIAGIGEAQNASAEDKKEALARLIDRMAAAQGRQFMVKTLEGDGNGNNTLIDDSMYKEKGTGRKRERVLRRDEIVSGSRLMRTIISSKMMEALREFVADEKNKEYVTQDLYRKMRKTMSPLVCNLIAKTIMTSGRYTELKDTGNRNRTVPDMEMERLEYLLSYYGARGVLFNVDKEMTPEEMDFLKKFGIDVLPADIKFDEEKAESKKASSAKKTEPVKAEKKAAAEAEADKARDAGFDEKLFEEEIDENAILFDDEVEEEPVNQIIEEEPKQDEKKIEAEPLNVIVKVFESGAIDATKIKGLNVDPANAKFVEYFTRAYKKTLEVQIRGLVRKDLEARKLPHSKADVDKKMPKKIVIPKGTETEFLTEFMRRFTSGEDTRALDSFRDDVKEARIKAGQEFDNYLNAKLYALTDAYRIAKKLSEGRDALIAEAKEAKKAAPTVYNDVKFDEKQTRKYSCWACSGAMVSNNYLAKHVNSADPKFKMTQGHFLTDQNIILNPRFKNNAQKDAEYKARVDAEVRNVLQVMDDWEMGNPFLMGDAYLKHMSDTAIKSTYFTIDRDNMMLKDPEAAEAIKTAMVEKIRTLLTESGGPVTLLRGKHYITVTGVEGGVIKYHDSKAEERDDPELRKQYPKKKNLPKAKLDATFDLTPDKLLEYCLGVSVQVISLIHLDEAKISDIKTEYGIGENDKQIYDAEGKMDPALDTADDVNLGNMEYMFQNLGVTFKKPDEKYPDALGKLEFTRDLIYLPKNLDHHKNVQDNLPEFENLRKGQPMLKPDQGDEDDDF